METPAPNTNPAPLLPPIESVSAPQMPSAKRQSLGAVIAIVVIVLMIVIGALYAWGQRIAQNGRYASETATTTGQ